jgi:hypothetical protein
MARLGETAPLCRTLASAACLALLVLFGAAAPSHADGGFQRCLDKAAGHNGEPPTCTKVGNHWVASWPDDPVFGPSNSGLGIPGWFVGVFVLVLVIGVGSTIWRVSTAQKLAKRSGMDAGLATQMTLLSEDGLEATYLAANLRGSRNDAEPAAATAATTPSTAERLEQLKSLLDRGLVTQAEYDQRRKAIIDSV